MRLLWVAAGAAVGYVLGAKAGRQRYEQILTAVEQWKDSPVVSQALDTASTVAERGKEAVARKL